MRSMFHLFTPFGAKTIVSDLPSGFEVDSTSAISLNLSLKLSNRLLGFLKCLEQS